ncbi:unnamed protein product [Effrenium voratum]|nr:unnamed protein product [Effrenium voratum]
MRIMLPHEEFDFKVTADAAVLADTVVFPVVAKILATKLRITALQQRLAEELLRMRQTEGSHWKLEPQDVPEFFDLGGLVSLEHGALGADPQNPLAMRASTCISARTFPQQARWKRQSLWQLAIQPQLFDGSHGAPMLSLVSALPTGLPRTPLSNVTTWVATYVQKVHPSQLEVVLLAVCVAEVLHFSASPAQELQVFAAFPNAQPVLRACMTLLCNPGGVIAAQAAIELGDGAAHVRLAPLWADLGRPFVGGMPRLSLRGHGDVLASLCFFVLDLSKVISGHNPPTMSIELAAASLALCAGLSPTREPWDLDPIVLPLVLPLVLDSEHLAAFLWTFPTSPQTGQVRQLDEFAAMIWLHSCFGLKMTSLYQPEWKPFSWKSAMPFEVDVALSRASLVNLFVIQLDVSEQTLATQPRLVKAVLRQAWQEETRLQIATGWFLWAECAAGFDWLVLISRKAPLHCFVLRVAEDRRKRRPTVAFAAVPVGQAVSRCALNRAKASLLLLGRPTVSRKLMPLRITQLFQPPGTLWAIGLSRTSWFVLKALDMQTGSPLSKAHQAHLLSALPEPAVLAGVVSQPRLVKAVLRQAWPEETRLQIATGWLLWAECAAGFDWLVLISRKAPLHCFVLRVAEDRRKRRPTVAFAAVPVGQAVSRCALNRAKASLLLLGRPTVSRKLMPLRLLQRPITQLFQPLGTLWAIGLSRTSWFVLKALDMQTGSPLSTAHQAHLLSALPEPAVLAGVVSQPRLVKAVLRQAWPEETRLQIATGWFLWAECAAGFDLLVLFSLNGGAPLQSHIAKIEPHVAATFEHDAALGATILAALMGSRSRRLEWIQDCQQVLLGSLIQAPGPNASSLRKAMLERPGHGPSEVQEQHALLPWKFYAMGGARCNEGAGLVVVNELSVAPLSTPSLPAWRMLKPPKSRIWASATVLLSRAPLLRALTFVKAVPRQSRRENLRVHLGWRQVALLQHVVVQLQGVLLAVCVAEVLQFSASPAQELQVFAAFPNAQPVLRACITLLCNPGGVIAAQAAIELGDGAAMCSWCHLGPDFGRPFVGGMPRLSAVRSSRRVGFFVLDLSKVISGHNPPTMSIELAAASLALSASLSMNISHSDLCRCYVRSWHCFSTQCFGDFIPLWLLNSSRTSSKNVLSWVSLLRWRQVTSCGSGRACPLLTLAKSALCQLQPGAGLDAFLGPAIGPLVLDGSLCISNYAQPDLPTMLYWALSFTLFLHLGLILPAQSMPAARVSCKSAVWAASIVAHLSRAPLPMVLSLPQKRRSLQLGLPELGLRQRPMIPPSKLRWFENLVFQPTLGFWSELLANASQPAWNMLIRVSLRPRKQLLVSCSSTWPTCQASTKLATAERYHCVQFTHPSQLEVVLLAVCVAEVLHFSASPAQELQVFAAFPNAQPVLRACITLLCNPGGVIAAQAAIELGDGAAHVRLAPLWADLGRPLANWMPKAADAGGLCLKHWSALHAPVSLQQEWRVSGEPHPSSGAESLILFGGGARLQQELFMHRVDAGSGFVCYHSMAPIEEVLKYGGCSSLLPEVLSRTSCSNLILAGHSLGVGVAYCLAEQLQTCGVEVQGILDLDMRSVPRTLLEQQGSASLPRALLQALARHMHVGTLQLRFEATLAPDLALPQRAFALTAELTGVTRPARRTLNDANHYSVGEAFVWDIFGPLNEIMRGHGST